MNRNIEPVVRIIPFAEQGNDFAYWQSQPYQKRIDALEQIREDYARSIDPSHNKDGKVERVINIVSKSKKEEKH